MLVSLDFFNVLIFVLTFKLAKSIFCKIQRYIMFVNLFFRIGSQMNLNLHFSFQWINRAMVLGNSVSGCPTNLEGQPCLQWVRVGIVLTFFSLLSYLFSFSLSFWKTA